MFFRLLLPRRSAYDDTFFWSGECQDNEVRLYIDALASGDHPRVWIENKWLRVGYEVKLFSESSELFQA